jgi:hypothetical protein
MRLAGHVALMGRGKVESAYGALVGRPEGKRSLERRKNRWEDIIRKDLLEMG